ncbi:MAG: isoprenoid biosynthesis glyoxalase ElbB [Bacteroidota bacterium]
MKTAVLLAGSGVYDGSEIHEATFALLHIEQQGGSYQCFAPDKEQFHVVNHLTGEPTSERRNVLVESARIARGAVLSLEELKVSDFDALVIPGGFGAAKNLNQWAISGPDGEIDELVRNAIRAFKDAGKPICGLCMGPTVIAKAFEGTTTSAILTVGTTVENSPYDIAAISAGMQSIGARPEMAGKKEISIDHENKIVTAPCYMMEATIS